jgi:hypothetical protein
MSKASDLNVLTGEQRSILLAVFRDCKDYYHNRRDYDSDYQSLSRASLDELYNGWKSFNSQLASGSMEVTVPVITRFPFSVARSTSDSVRAIRQVLGLFTRLEGFCDSDPALSAYRQRVSAARAKLPDVYVEVARSLVKAWLGPAPSLLDLRPQHGPGAVAEGYKQWEKAHFKYTFRQLRPYGAELLYLNGRHLAEEPRNLQELRHPITRVICVPKDFSKPRIISAEPCVMQFLQQGVARYMMSVLEQRCPYLNFRDQSVNAILSKKWDAVATLDMSDASDTVSRRIVRQLFPADWADLVFSLRSHFAELPDGTRVPLRAFAPMGSALCFPVESVIFAAVAGSAMLCMDGGKWFSKERRQYFRVYGDDIIVPRDAAEYVLAVLRETGFRPNESKCCTTGYFRESCGAEWWRGDDVTVVRPRSLSALHVSRDTRGLSGELPMVAHAKALYQHGFPFAAQKLADCCDFPVALGTGPGYCPPALHWPKPGRIRWNPKLQRCEQESTLPIQIAAPSDTGSGYNSLFLGIVSGWQSEQVLTPRISAKRKWVLAAPLADRE